MLTLHRFVGLVIVAAIAYFAVVSLVEGISGAIPVGPQDRLPEDPGLRAAVASRRVMAEKEKVLTEGVDQFHKNLSRLAAGGTTAKDDLREFAQQMQAVSEAALADYHAISDRSLAYRRDLKHAETAYAEAARSLARRGEDYTDPQLKAAVAVYAADFERVAARIGHRARALDRFHAELDEMKAYIVQTQYAVTDLRAFVEAYPDSRQAEARVIFDNHVKLYAGRFDKLVRLLDEYRAAIQDTVETPSPNLPDLK